MLTMQDIICWESGEKYPDKSGEYLTITQNGSLMVLPFSARHCGWNLEDDDDSRDYEMHVKFWAVLPDLAVQVGGYPVR